MRKHSQNVIIDGILFLCLMVLLGTGLIMYWVLPAGSRGEVFLNYTRHEWGNLHFWVAMAFTIVIIFHLSLHFSWIVNSYRPFKKKRN